MIVNQQAIDEGWLFSEIELHWGPAGAHVDIFRTMLNDREKSVKLLRNFQRMYLEHLDPLRGSGVLREPIYTITDALYAAINDLLGKVDK